MAVIAGQDDCKRMRALTVSRRQFLRAAGGGAVAAGALAAAAGRPAASWAAVKGIPTIQGEAVELTYWHGWTEQWEEMVQYVVDMFHEKQSRIRITPKVIPQDQLLTKLTA